MGSIVGKKIFLCFSLGFSHNTRYSRHRQYTAQGPKVAVGQSPLCPTVFLNEKKIT